MIIGGVDEAGRGPVIGPMVVAGVSMNSESIKRLARIIKDSKKLTPQMRIKLEPVIRSAAHRVVIKIVDPKTIDEWISKYRGGLNLLELELFTQVLNELDAEVVYVDSCDVKPKRFEERLRERGLKAKVISELKADEKYPIVSAASIIAKVHRDEEINKLKKKYGDFGSGYPSDQKTIKFIKNALIKGCLPPIVRKSYKTILRLREEVFRDQLSLP